MKYIALTLCLLLVFLPFMQAKENYFPMKYEGGSLPLDQHDDLKVGLSPKYVEILQDEEKYLIPASAITEISYGNDVHRRVGAAVGVALVTFGIGALMLLIKTKKHYVGIIWDNANGVGTTAKGGVIFKVGKGEYRGFIAGLEGLTGKKAVNADAAGQGGTSNEVVPAQEVSNTPPAQAAPAPLPSAPPPTPASDKVLIPIASDPPGASVFLNENFIGMTPLKVKLAPGPCKLRLYLNGYAEWSQEIQILEGSEPNISVQLKPGRF